MRPFILSLVMLAGAAAAALRAAQPAPPRVNFGPVGGIQKVADDTYVVPGAGGNSVVFVTAKGVLLVDTKTPNNGQPILDQVKTVTDKPVVAIVNTHVHFDHTGSNAFFPENVEIVAHERAAARLQKDPAFQDPAAKRGLVDRTYKDRLTLFSGPDTVELYYTGAAHTDGDSFVVFRRARVMAAGDAFAGRMQPIIDVENGGSGVAYPETLAKAAAAIANVDVVVPGHAPATTWQNFVEYAEFNRAFLEHARASLKAGKTAQQAMDDFKAVVPAKFKDIPLGAGMMTGPAGNFESIYRELQPR